MNAKAALVRHLIRALRPILVPLITEAIEEINRKHNQLIYGAIAEIISAPMPRRIKTGITETGY